MSSLNEPGFSLKKRWVGGIASVYPDLVVTSCRVRFANLVLVPARKLASALVLRSEMVGWLGLEPRTNALKGHCSTS